MLQWALCFFILAAAFAVEGFSGSESVVAVVCKVLFFVFTALFIATSIVGLARRP